MILESHIPHKIVNLLLTITNSKQSVDDMMMTIEPQDLTDVVSGPDRFYLTEGIYLLISESQLPRKTVN